MVRTIENGTVCLNCHRNKGKIGSGWDLRWDNLFLLCCKDKKIKIKDKWVDFYY